MPPSPFDYLCLRIAVAACCLLPVFWFLLWPKGWRCADRFDQVLYVLLVAVVMPWGIAGILLDSLPRIVTGLAGWLVAALLGTYVIRSIRWSRRTQREMTALTLRMQAERARADADAATAIAAIEATERAAAIDRRRRGEPTDPQEHP